MIYISEAMNMGRLIVDADQLQSLDGGKKSADVCDETGRVLGLFLPQDEYIRLLYQIEVSRPADLEARRKAREDLAAGRCKTTEQILEGFARIRQGWENPS